MFSFPNPALKLSLPLRHPLLHHQSISPSSPSPSPHLYHHLKTIVPPSSPPRNISPSTIISSHHRCSEICSPPSFIAVHFSHNRGFTSKTLTCEFHTENPPPPLPSKPLYLPISLLHILIICIFFGMNCFSGGMAPIALHLVSSMSRTLIYELC